jgi:hypothetical protein
VVTAIYHITHITNLGGIADRGEICCDKIRIKECLKTLGVGHDHMKARRMTRPVTRGPGGTLGDYVPFYFAP